MRTILLTVLSSFFLSIPAYSMIDQSKIWHDLQLEFESENISQAPAKLTFNKFYTEEFSLEGHGGTTVQYVIDFFIQINSDYIELINQMLLNYFSLKNINYESLDPIQNEKIWVIREGVWWTNRQRFVGDIPLTVDSIVQDGDVLYLSISQNFPLQHSIYRNYDLNYEQTQFPLYIQIGRLII